MSLVGDGGSQGSSVGVIRGLEDVNTVGRLSWWSLWCCVETGGRLGPLVVGYRGSLGRAVEGK